MNASAEHIDKPEPRWQAILAFLAIGGIYLALPAWVIVGPIWLLPALIAMLLVPTVVTHRMGRHSLNHALGIAISSTTTLALIGSVILLVTALPTHREAPLSLLLSGGELWLTNVLVFALWYWRLDGGGPTVRDRRRESNADDSMWAAGVQGSSIIFSLRSRRVRPSDQPMPPFWRAGQKSLSCARFSSP